MVFEGAGHVPPRIELIRETLGWLDRYLVDGVLNAVSAWTLRAGDVVRRVQTGLAQDYVYGVALGILLLLIWAQWGTP